MLGKKNPVGKNRLNAQKVEPIIKGLVPLPKEDVFQSPAFPYKRIEGSFGLMTWSGDKVTNVSWEGCRYRFQSSSAADNVMSFLFYHHSGVGQHVVDFIRT